MTLDERLHRVNGRPTGFDYMRIILACCVVGWHSIVTSYGPEYQSSVQSSPWRAIAALLLPMFFSLSGFLVAGSLERSRTLLGFLGQRLIRIYPALTVEVLLSAILLGPLLTSVSLLDYFTDTKFFLYLVNVTGHIHYELPGVFLNNPNPERVNGQLWTVPFELYCYVVISGFGVIGLTRHRRMFILAVLTLWGAIVAGYLHRQGVTGSRVTAIMPGYMLIVCFLIGIGFYLWRDKVRWSASWGLIAGAMGLILLSLPPYGDYAAPLPLAYLTIYLGLTNFRKISLLQGADYSYGIFLYGYVIQQAYMSLSPSLHHWWMNVGVALPTSALFAAVSWHWVEKPALNFKKPLKRLEDAWISKRQRFLPQLPETLGQLQIRQPIKES